MPYPEEVGETDAYYLDDDDDFFPGLDEFGDGEVFAAEGDSEDQVAVRESGSGQPVSSTG